jgi:hypothetical protein
MIKRLLAALALCVATTYSIQAQAAQAATPVGVVTSSAKGGLKIIARGRPAFVLVEAADLAAVRRAAGDLQDDLARVAGGPAPRRRPGRTPGRLWSSSGPSVTARSSIAWSTRASSTSPASPVNGRGLSNRSSTTPFPASPAPW